MTYSEVKHILGREPIGIQLRDIRNMSWIEKRILEILVDVNHAQRMRHRIGTYSNYHIKTRFDPLSSDSFNWEEGLLPEAKMKILQRNFVTRLSTSMSSTNDPCSRQFIVDFVRNRGLGQQLEKEVERLGIVMPSSASHDQSPVAGPSRYRRNHPSRSSPSNDRSVIASAVKYGKRKLSVSSDEIMER
jgi:hypothetical protein